MSSEQGLLTQQTWVNKIDLIKRTIAKGASDDELQLFLHQCQRTGLDPLAKQIYFQKRANHSGGSTITIITGIDGYRTIAARTCQYAGSDDPLYDNEDAPKKATVAVYRLVGGLRCAFTASARWDQYFPGDKLGFMWRKMPHLMLGKCAEALALRKAFPAELSGLYVKEEMDQAGKQEDSGAADELLPVYVGNPIQKKFLKTEMDTLGIPRDRWPKVHEDAIAAKITMENLHEFVEDFART